MALVSYPTSDLGFGKSFFQFGVLAAGGAQHVLHANWFACFGGEEGGVERYVADVAAGDVETRQACNVQVLGGGVGWEDAPPDFGALRGIREWELHDEANAAQEGGVQRVFQIG